MIEQTETEVARHLREQAAMEAVRAPWVSLWREVDEWVDPELAGGFYPVTPSSQRSAHIFDSTAPEGLDRFTAAIAGLVIPSGSRWHGLTTTDTELNKLPAVRRWCEQATDVLFAARYASGAGFEMQAHADIRQLGKYGTCPLWIGEDVGRGLFYRAVHLSEVFIAEDFRGQVTRAHRKFSIEARDAATMLQVPVEALPDAIQKCVVDDNGARGGTKFEFLHVMCPRADYERGDPGPRGLPYESLYIAIEAKQIVRRGGYRSMPMPVSRNVVSPGSVYGRSPAMKVLGPIKTLNSMAMTMLRAAHKQVDPALAFYDDGTVSKVVTKPGGLNPGLVDDFGRLMVHEIPHGGDISGGMAFQEAEREPVRDAFLEHVFKILTDPSDRMTATQVLETIQKQGVLVAPFAARDETEKRAPQIARELDLLENAGQLPPRPPEMLEAAAGVKPIYDNPLSKMRRADEAAGFTRLVEISAQIAGATQSPDVFDHINADAAIAGVAEVLNVRPSWLATPEEVAAKRKGREDAAQAAQLTEALPAAAGAALDISRANQIAAAA